MGTLYEQEKLNVFLPCSEQDCFEILPNSKLLKSHKSKAHGIQKSLLATFALFCQNMNMTLSGIMI